MVFFGDADGRGIEMTGFRNGDKVRVRGTPTSTLDAKLRKVLTDELCRRRDAYRSDLTPGFDPDFLFYAGEAWPAIFRLTNEVVAEVDRLYAVAVDKGKVAPVRGEPVATHDAFMRKRMAAILDRTETPRNSGDEA